MPNLVTKIEKEIRLTQFKIAYNLLQNVVVLSYMQNKYPPTQNETTLTAEQIFDIYYKPYLKIAKDCGFGSQTGNARCFASPTGGFYNIHGVEPTAYPATNYYKVILQNGMSLGIVPTGKGGSNCFASAIFVIDVDGPSKGYSKLGQDVFYFSYVDSKHYGNSEGCRKIPHVRAVLPGGLYILENPSFCTWGANINRNIGACTSSGLDSNGRYAGIECSTLIVKNGLQYPQDYPWDIINKRPAGFVKYK